MPVLVSPVERIQAPVPPTLASRVNPATPARRQAASNVLDVTLRDLRLVRAFDQGRLTDTQSLRVARAIADRTAVASRQATQLLLDRNLTLPQWRAEMARGLLAAHQAAVMARTGLTHLPPAEQETLARYSARQIEFLDRFAAEIRSGAQLRNGTALSRADLYGHAVWAVSQGMDRARAQREGFDEEISYLGSLDHCDMCLSEADRGWVPIGSLVPIGARTCQSRCGCRIAYRRSPAAIAVESELISPPSYGPSLAPIQVGEEEDGRIRSIAEMEGVIRERLGLPLSLQDLASAVGATDDANVMVSPFGKKLILVEIKQQGVYKAERLISRDERKDRLVISNESFMVEPEHQGRGLGTEVFGRQVEQAARLGFDRIETYAARGEDLNGYYTWPRFGYDGAIPANVPQRPESLSGAKNFSDLMMTPEGRAWWKANGKAVDVTFDLSKNSLSRTIWDGYRQERASQAR